MKVRVIFIFLLCFFTGCGSANNHNIINDNDNMTNGQSEVIQVKIEDDQEGVNQEKSTEEDVLKLNTQALDDTEATIDLKNNDEIDTEEVEYNEEITKNNSSLQVIDVVENINLVKKIISPDGKNYLREELLMVQGEYTRTYYLNEEDVRILVIYAGRGSLDYDPVYWISNSEFYAGNGQIYSINNSTYSTIVEVTSDENNLFIDKDKNKVVISEVIDYKHVVRLIDLETGGEQELFSNNIEGGGSFYRSHVAAITDKEIFFTGYETNGGTNIYAYGYESKSIHIVKEMQEIINVIDDIIITNAQDENQYIVYNQQFEELLRINYSEYVVDNNIIYYIDPEVLMLVAYNYTEKKKFQLNMNDYIEVSDDIDLHLVNEEDIIHVQIFEIGEYAGEEEKVLKGLEVICQLATN